MRHVIAAPAMLLLTALLAAGPTQAADTPNLHGQKLYLDGEKVTGSYTLDVVRQPCAAPDGDCEGGPFCSLFPGGCYTYSVRLVADGWQLEFDLFSYQMAVIGDGRLGFTTSSPDTGIDVYTLVVDGTPILRSAAACETIYGVEGTMELIDGRITIRMHMDGPTNNDRADHCGFRSGTADFTAKMEVEP